MFFPKKLAKISEIFSETNEKIKQLLKNKGNSIKIFNVKIVPLLNRNKYKREVGGLCKAQLTQVP